MGIRITQLGAVSQLLDGTPIAKRGKGVAGLTINIFP